MYYFLEFRLTKVLLSIFVLNLLKFTFGLATSKNETVIEVISCNYKELLSKNNTTWIASVFVDNNQQLHTRFKDAALKCNFGNFKTVLFSKFDSSLGKSARTNGNQIFQVEESKTRFTPEGYLKIGVDSYSPAEYCIDQLNSTKILATVCTRGCSRGQHCIRKCCEGTQLWDVLAEACVDALTLWNPPFYTISENCAEKVPFSIDTGNSIKVRSGLPQKCLKIDERNLVPSINIPNYGLGRFRLLVNGSVLVNHEKNGSWYILEPESYCIDGMINYGIGVDFEDGSVINSSEAHQVLLVCKDAFKVKDMKRRIPFKYAAMLFSAATILLVNTIVYLLLWDKHNIYEWTVFFEVISMLFMILFVGASHTAARNPNSGHLTSGSCVFLGAASHFFFLATFFWLLIINFEIWWNFRTLTIRNKKSRRWLRLLNYQLFAWGCPLMIIITGLILDGKYGLQNDEIDCQNIIVPNYGQLNCYISKRAQGPYLYFPVGVLLGCNLLFYTLTVFKMCEYKKTSQAMTQSRNRGNFQPVVVFARLFIVMGVSWIFEIVAWALSPADKGVVPLYWVVFDIVTLLQAIAIFVIFICRKEILQKLGDKYPRLKPFLAPLFDLPCCGLPPKVQPSPSPRSVVENDLNTVVKRSTEEMTTV